MNYNVLKSVGISTLLVTAVFFTSALTSYSDGPIEACFIQIVKQANPPGETEFNFTGVSSEGDGIEFALRSPGDPEQTIVFNPTESITVTEELTEGWELESVFCETSEGMLAIPVENGRRFECSQAEARATCVFRNINENLISVPALTNWGLMAAAAALAIIGFYFIRRKSAAKTS